MEGGGVLYVSSDCLQCREISGPGPDTAIDELTRLAYDIHRVQIAENSKPTASSDIILGYDYHSGMIQVCVREVDAKVGISYYESVPAVTYEIHDEYPEVGYVYEEATKFQYCAHNEELTTTIGTSVEFQQKFRKSSITKNGVTQSKESQDVRFQIGGRGFYAVRPTKHCVFCRKNGEPQTLYRTHVLRENGTITCPVLRKYVCPVCNASGDFAHTLKHCPKNKGDSAIIGRHEVSRSGRNARGILGKTYRYE